jgi:hypothetical protein
LGGGPWLYALNPNAALQRSKQKWRALRNVATKTTRTQTDLLTKAIDDLAAKYGKQILGPTTTPNPGNVG